MKTQHKIDSKHLKNCKHNLLIKILYISKQTNIKNIVIQFKIFVQRSIKNYFIKLQTLVY